MKNLYLISCCLLVLFVSIKSSAQTPALVRDINNGNPSSNLYLNGIIFNNNYIFSADDGLNGRELWITDGTTNATVLVKDISSGGAGSDPVNFFIYNNIVFFKANDGVHGTELWRTDGTGGGTYMVKDILPGAGSAFYSTYGYNGPIPLLNVWENNGSFFFVASSNYSSGIDDDVELWKSDGTTAGTVRVFDINPGLNASYPEDFNVFNNALYFKANDGSHGDELWKTDGTNTQLVKDILPGSNSAFYSYYGYNGPIPFVNFWEHNGSFFFVARSNFSSGNDDDVELWKSDGTTGGTVRVYDINPGLNASYPEDFNVFNNALYFKANDGTHGDELWKTDGTNTQLVKDILPGSNSAFYSYYGYNGPIPFVNFWEHNGSFFFVASSNYSSGIDDDVELWKSDGTTAGTVRVFDINPGLNASYPEDFNVFNNALYFKANDGTHGDELWKTDGSNTQLVKDILPGSASAFYSYYAYNGPIPLVNVWEHNGSFFFIASSNYSSGSDDDVELWKSDGTTGGTVRVYDINPGLNSSYPRNFVVFSNQLFFAATDPTHGFELWKTDGSNTSLVKDIYPGSSNGLYNILYKITQYNGSFYFQAFSQGFSDNEIWKSDGTTAGTVEVMDIYSGAGGSDANSFVQLPNDYLIFQATDNTHGKELWSMYLQGITGVEEVLSNSLLIFPNPVNNQSLMIKLNGSFNGSSAVQVFDGKGMLVLDKKTELSAFDKEFPLILPDLQPGIYFLRLEDTNKNVYSKKFAVVKN